MDKSAPCHSPAGNLFKAAYGRCLKILMEEGEKGRLKRGAFRHIEQQGKYLVVTSKGSLIHIYPNPLPLRLVKQVLHRRQKSDGFDSVLR